MVARSNEFERQDMHIYSTVSISYPIAVLGGDIRIKTVDGDIIYTVSAGTQTGTRIRLRGKGVPSLRNKDVRGDHYVTLVIKTPTKISKEAEAALREFDKATGDSLNKEVDTVDIPKEKKKGPFEKFFG